MTVFFDESTPNCEHNPCVTGYIIFAFRIDSTLITFTNNISNQKQLEGFGKIL